MSDVREPTRTVGMPTGTDGELELKGLLGQFTLSFLKALMMSGIYPADHPVIADIADEPFQLLKRLAPDANEITFMSASAAVGDEIMVEGVLSEGILFTTLLSSSMGEVFARKFIAYFERNQLVSFSVKTRIGKEEFQRLISVFAERRSQEERGEPGALSLSFGELLLQREIVHVTAMSRLEMVGGERPLPWRVKMAISRLRKDLRIVPLYSEATALELATAKRQLVQDITRPLRRPQFLKDLLANTDLISEGLEELLSVDVRQEIILGLHGGMLVNISWDIVGDLERVSWGALVQKIGSGKRRLDQIYKSILKSIAMRLHEEEPAAVSSLMHHLFDKKILVFAELPDTLQQELVLEKWTDQFLKSREEVLRRFATLDEAKVHREYAGTFRRVLPELLRRGKLREAHSMLRAVHSQVGVDFPKLPERSARATELLENLATAEVLDRLAAIADTADKETRRLAMESMAWLGEPALAVMLGLLTTSELAPVRRDLVKAIERFGDDAFVPLMELMQTKGLDWYAYRNAILLVGKTGCVPAADDVRKFLSHPHPRVREEAVQALALLLEDGAMMDLLPLARDRSSTVARRTIALLVRMGCRLPPFLDELAGLVRMRGENEAPVAEDVQRAALDAIVQLSPFAVAGRPVQELLMERLQRRSGMLRKLLKRARGEDRNPPALRAAICDTLGRIGDGSVRPVLNEALEDPDEQVRRAAAEALGKLASRSR